MARKHDPTTEQLLALIPHIRYDLVQMIECAKLCPRGQAKSVQESAFVDGTLVYARKLLVFMDPPPRRDWRQGDVYACDYITGWSIPDSWWSHTNPEMMKAISTRSAHICLERIDKLSWRISTITGSVAEAMSDFISRIAEPYRTAFAQPTRHEIKGQQVDAAIALHGLP